MVISEWPTYHPTVMKNQKLLENLASKNLQLLIKNQQFLTQALMNFSLNGTNLQQIIDLQFLNVANKILESDIIDPEMHLSTIGYCFTFARQILKVPNLKENLSTIFNQGIA